MKVVHSVGGIPFTVDVLGDAWYDALAVVYLGIIQGVRRDVEHAMWHGLAKGKDND